MARRIESLFVEGPAGRLEARLAGQEADIQKVIAVGFPTTIPDRDYVYSITVPKYFIHSTNDEFGPREAFLSFYQSLPEPKYLEWVESGDHFFRDGLDQFEKAV